LTAFRSGFLSISYVPLEFGEFLDLLEVQSNRCKLIKVSDAEIKKE
jgi:hypothetical protein